MSERRSRRKTEPKRDTARCWPRHTISAMSDTGQVTALLHAWSNGDEGALDALVPLVYDELRRLARFYMRRERHGVTLQPTAVVHEVFLRLIDIRRVRWQDRAHFLAISARLMRRVLIDVARTRAAAKRAGGVPQLAFDENLLATKWSNDFIALNDALDSLASLDPRRSQVVELRFFGGLDIDETAEA